MAVFIGPSIVNLNQGLIYHIDAAENNCYSYSENLINYSEQVSSWATASVAILTDQTISPNNTITADQITVLNTVSSIVYQGVTTIQNRPYTFSFWIKSTSTNVSGTWGVNWYSNNSLHHRQTVPVTPNWNRVSFTFTATDVAANIYIADNRSNLATVMDAYVWGAQLQASPWLEKYTPTTTTSTTATYTVNDLSLSRISSSLNSVNVANNFPVYSSTQSGAIMFAGTDTYIRTASLGTMTQYTFSFWARYDAINRMAVSSGNGGYYWYGDNSWRWGHGAVGGEHYYTKNLTIPLGGWGNWTATYDGTVVSVYRQGVFQSSATTSTSVVDLTSGLTIGWWGNQNYAWTGPISVVQVYNRALSANEVRQNFEANRDRYGL